MKPFTMFGIVLFIALVILVLNITNQLTTETVTQHRIIELQQQQLIEGSKESMKTKIRYLVVTDKETFVCKSSWLNGKFNNSDVFFRLKKDSTYNLKVAGFGKNLLFDYRNILEILK